MRKILVTIFSVVVLLAATTAGATRFTLDSMNIALNNSDPGLVLEWNQLLSNGSFFDLNNVGDVVTAKLFNVGTAETTVNPDDQASRPITASFNFTPPGMVANDGGVSYGTSEVWGIFQYGHVRWGNPILVDFGNTGQISLDLTDADFGGLFTPKGFADVYGTIILTKADTAPVPEPGTMVLLGAGLLGLAVFGKRRMKNA